MRAVADYVTRESTLLSFRKGDVIRVVRDEQYVDKGKEPNYKKKISFSKVVVVSLAALLLFMVNYLRDWLRYLA